jgi:transposase, IS5 family
MGRQRSTSRALCPAVCVLLSGQSLEAETPDQASIWRFRQAFRQRFPRRPGNSTARLIVERGTLVDATLIAACVKCPAYGGGGGNQGVPDARVPMKRKKAHSGYKAHAAVDEVSGLVWQIEMTSANVQTPVCPKR